MTEQPYLSSAVSADIDQMQRSKACSERDEVWEQRTGVPSSGDLP